MSNYMTQFRGSLAAILSSSLILQPVAARVYEHLQSFTQLHAQAFLPPFFWVPPFADPSFFRAPPFSGPLLFLGPSFSGPFLPAVFRVSLSLIEMLSLFWALLFLYSLLWLSVLSLPFAGPSFFWALSPPPSPHHPHPHPTNPHPTPNARPPARPPARAAARPHPES